MSVNEQCLSVFKSFINDIIKVFPEYKIKLEDVYKPILQVDTCIIDDNELLSEFLDRIHKLNKKITNKDDTMFDDDPLILTDISFKNIWVTNISYKTKETIWKYLQTFCLISLNHNSNKELQTALSDLSENKVVELTDKKLASDVKKIKKLTENIKGPIAEDISNDNYEEGSDQGLDQGLDQGTNPFEQLMNNSEIGKIAELVSKDLDIEKLLAGNDSDNPMDIFSSLMSGGGLNKIMGTINTIVNTKMESGELNKDSMMNEAQGMYGQMGQSELFQQMTQQMTQQNNDSNAPKGGDSRTGDTRTVDTNDPHKSNKTKARLQNKLKEKQKIQVNKVTK